MQKPRSPSPSPSPLSHVLRALVLSGAFAFAVPLALASALPKGVSQLSTVEGITEYRLPNGLKVLLMPDSSKATTTVNLTYLVGSRHESAGQSGYAHLLEHMLYRGSTNFPQISAEIGKRGMRWNGTTTVDRTNYFESFEASDSDLDWVLKMEADRMQNASILASELTKEMTVVRNELELGESEPHKALLKRVSGVAYD